MEELFNPVSILLHVVNAVILLTALYFLLYKPVRKFMNARTEKVRGEIEAAQELSRQAQEQIDQSRQSVRQAEEEAAQTSAEASVEAQKRAQEILDAANARAQEIIAAAQREAEMLRQNAQEAAADTAVALAVDIAGKILQREITPEDNARLIQEFMKRVE